MYKETILKSFDNTSSARVRIVRPEKYHQLFDIITASEKVISRGSGLNYAPASFGKKVVSIDTSHFNRILSFDDQEGIVTVEPGIKIGDLLTFLIPRGWFLPVLPGHPQISIGGCTAANVHGKSQLHSGNFIDCISSLKVFHPDCGEITCSAEKENPTLFALTVGGFGLTGHITEVTLQLERKKGNTIRLDRIPASNIHDAIDIMRDKADKYDYIYSWHNLMRRGKKFGKGVILAESFSKEQLPAQKLDNALSADRKVTPLCVYQPVTMPIINRIYEWKEFMAGKSQLLDIHSATFPIHGKEFYFSLMGRKGFLECQMIIPFSKVHPFLEELARKLERSKLAVSLGSLKIFSGRPENINFCGEGICLALDIPFSRKGLALFTAIDQMVIKYQCPVNVGKDSRLTGDVLKATFPEYDKFKTELRRWDPQKRFSSEMRERLNL